MTIGSLYKPTLTIVIVDIPKIVLSSHSLMKRRTISKADAGIFDYQNWVEYLAQHSCPLDRLLSMVDFEGFREALESPLMVEPRAPGGRPAFDSVLMFKVLVLQRLHGLSDDQAEFQVKDRFSFQRFLGLTIADRMPDAKTIWKYREDWTRSHTVERCFELSHGQLRDRGLVECPGKIIDATFVDVPKQRNTREDNATIKETGQAPQEWDDNHAKKSQKDTDARWAKKNNETHYGYKCHTAVSSLLKLIECYAVTPATTHDSQEFLSLLFPDRDKAAQARATASGAQLAARSGRVRSTTCRWLLITA